ncbi:MAG: aldo/keto reductase, partial [Deltaproteobacteria bacterium]|nr:aldo/keto reductase [Deltaproteobacteria bacterium]
MAFDRRTFLKTLAAATASLALQGARTRGEEPAGADRLGPLLPQRLLGSTGAWVTMLGVGGWHLGEISERDAQKTIEAALEGGIRFFDTAEMYQAGLSENRYGKWLVPKYRDLVFLMTKSA